MIKPSLTIFNWVLIFIILILLISCQRSCPSRVIYYFDTGEKAIVRHYDNKCNHYGVDTIWSRNGCISRIETFKNNQLDGVVKEYVSEKCDSNFFYYCEYKDGVSHGESFQITSSKDTSFHYIYRNGKIVKKIIEETFEGSLDR